MTSLVVMLTLVTEHWIIYSRSFPQVIHTVYNTSMAPLPASVSPAGAGAYLPPTFFRPPREIFPAGAGALAILVWPLAPMHQILTFDLFTSSTGRLRFSLAVMFSS